MSSVLTRGNTKISHCFENKPIFIVAFLLLLLLLLFFDTTIQYLYCKRMKTRKEKLMHTNEARLLKNNNAILRWFVKSW